jgi:hypothetical protein
MKNWKTVEESEDGGRWWKNWRIVEDSGRIGR